MQNRRTVEKFIMLNWRIADISVKIDHYLPMNRHKVPSNLTLSYKWRQRHLWAMCLLFFLLLLHSWYRTSNPPDLPEAIWWDTHHSCCRIFVIIGQWRMRGLYYSMSLGTWAFLVPGASEGCPTAKVTNDTVRGCSQLRVGG